MIREIVVPQSEHYTLHIPKEYVNTAVEILVLPLSLEKEKENKYKKTIQELTKETAGILSDKKINPLQWQEEIRSEWDEREEILDRLKYNNIPPK